MIISLRGTSGSGKSTLVRKITALYASGGTPHFVAGRRKAYYTIHARDNPLGRALVVPGHYEIANGGIDTLDTLDEAYDIARRADSDGHDVLMEGKNMSDGPPHALNLYRERRDIRIVHVCETINKCVRSVAKRGHNITISTIERTHDKCLRDITTFRCIGLPHVRQEGREECFKIVKYWLAL